jgi:hypothetical protein
MAMPSSAPPQPRAGVTVDPLWIVAAAFMACIGFLDYGAIVGSASLIVAGVVAGAIGVAVMVMADRD